MESGHFSLTVEFSDYISVAAVHVQLTLKRAEFLFLLLYEVSQRLRKKSLEYCSAPREVRL